MRPRRPSPAELLAQAAEIESTRKGLFFHPACGWNTERGAAAHTIARHLRLMAGEAGVRRG
jgi:hypothetical protein